MRNLSLGWSALGHETAGHDVIHAYKGLRHELSRNVQDTLSKEKLKNGLPDYWSTRLHESTSDVLGILNIVSNARARSDEIFS